MGSTEVNHSNAAVVVLDGESLYDKALYIQSDLDLEKSDNINFSKPLTSKQQIVIQFNTQPDGASFLAIGIEERKKLAAWLLEGL